MRFEKWQALGNDYLILEREAIPFPLTPARARLLCERHRGVGSDGVLLLSAPADPAHVADLRRTRIGSFGEAEMRTLDHIGPDSLLTPAEAMRDLDAVTVELLAAASIRTGLPLDRVPIGATGEGPWAMLDEGGNLLAVYEATGTDRIRPAVVLAES